MKNDLLKNRAWIEIDLSSLKHNVEEIKKILKPNTKIMAVVKANAYGHGLTTISSYLNTLGIMDFAVATLEEGMNLRKNGIKGNILILGYTSIENLKYVSEYNLIQTIVDESYAKKLKKLNIPLKVQIKVNTGMNRIGISYQKKDTIKEIYQYSNLEVMGLFSHLSSSEQYEKEDIGFTNKQINRFHDVINYLKEQNINYGKIHLQSSYGLVNYPELEYDYTRIGMILYGNHSEKNMHLKINLDLKPILSLKARVTSVKEIEEGETVGYDRTYQANSIKKVATISIGYADGYPRNLSGKAFVFVNGFYGTIIGRICMDQLMLDVTGIEVNVGDIVTLIGLEEKVRAEFVSYQAGTITNELLSRLGSRLPILYQNENKQ